MLFPGLWSSRHGKIQCSCWYCPRSRSLITPLLPPFSCCTYLPGSHFSTSFLLLPLLPPLCRKRSISAQSEEWHLLLLLIFSLFALNFDLIQQLYVSMKSRNIPKYKWHDDQIHVIIYFVKHSFLEMFTLLSVGLKSMLFVRLYHPTLLQYLWLHFFTYFPPLLPPLYSTS